MKKVILLQKVLKGSVTTEYSPKFNQKMFLEINLQ